MRPTSVSSLSWKARRWVQGFMARLESRRSERNRARLRSEPARARTSMRKTMKSTIRALTIIGLAAGLAAPAMAIGPDADGLVHQQDTCEEGQVWDEKQRKCVQKPKP